jgi:hypothetical protein
MWRTYAVFGAIGISIYLGYLADVVFKDSLLFPFALSPIGIAVMPPAVLSSQAGGNRHMARSAFARRRIAIGRRALAEKDFQNTPD